MNVHGTGSTPTDGAASTWRAPQLDLSPLLECLDAASDAGADRRDLELEFSTDAVDGALARLAAVDEAERRADEGEMLTVPAVPEVRACRRWLLTEIHQQGRGADATAWHLPGPTDPALEPIVLSVHERAEVMAALDPTIVADDGNRIVMVNGAVADLLNTDAEELEGARLTTIIPSRFREAHLAGFTRYQLSGESRIVGRSLRVPALRGDGTEVEVELTIEVWPRPPGRAAFVATLRPAPSPSRDG